MNKKKKTTRIKHRKNKDRMRKILHASLLKAKPKKVVSTQKVEAPLETEVKATTEPIVKKATSKKKTTKKPAARKTSTKKTASKKTPTKKNASKKTPTKKTHKRVHATTYK